MAHITGELILDKFYSSKQENSFYQEQEIDANKHWDDENSLAAVDTLYYIDKKNVMRAQETKLMR